MYLVRLPIPADIPRNTMPRVTTAYVKNIVRRGFNELIDPEPTSEERNHIWLFFDSCCAYCGQRLNREKQEGRIDHAVAASDEGHNGMANRVLACGPCNDHEKRNEPWESFLRRKNADDTVFAKRRGRILDWIELNKGMTPPNELRQAAIAAAAEVNSLFDAKALAIKTLMGR